MPIVYILENITNDKSLYKIGYSKFDTATSRIQKLQTGNPFLIKEHFIFKSKYALKIEKSLHNFFKHKNLKGEWFEFDLEEISKIKEMCKTLERNFEFLEKNALEI